MIVKAGNKDTLYNLVGLMQYLNDNFKVKKTGNQFTAQDVQQYIKTGNIPKYLGGQEIICVDKKNKLYRLSSDGVQ